MKQDSLYQHIGSLKQDVSLRRAVAVSYRRISPFSHSQGSLLNLLESRIMIAAINLVVIFITSAFCIAEETNDSRRVSQNESSDSKIIERIVVVPQNVFGKKDIENSRALKFVNRIHTPTRKYVILRESLLRVGDVFDPELAYETERNLRKLPFIYEASVVFDTSITEGNTLYIKTVDRWSLSAGLKVLRRSERNLFQFGVTESNFIGLGQRIGVTYTITKPDPSYFRFEFNDPRLLGSFNEFGVDVVNNPLDRSLRVTIRRRFLHQSDTKSYLLTYLNQDQRNIDVTSSGDTAATYFQEGSRVRSGFAIRAGDFHRKFGISISHRYNDVKIRDLVSLNGYSLNDLGELIPPVSQSPSDTFFIPKDSSLHEFSVNLSASRSDFIAVKRVKYQRRIEDLTLVNGVGFGFGQGRGKSLDSHLYTTWGAAINYGVSVSNFIVAGGTSRNSWVKDGREFRSILHSSVIAYHTGLSWSTFAARTFFSFDNQKDNPNPLAVNGVSGVRGYPANFITGNKLLVGNFESRIITGLTAYTAGLGFALHFDFGAAWGEGDKLGIRRFVWSAGPGLRIDMGQIGTIRLDVSYLEALNSWAISAETGQFFDLNPGK